MTICLANAAIGVTTNNTSPINATPLSIDELPHGLKLLDDYLTTLITDSNRPSELNTAAGCEYSCDNSYRVDNSQYPRLCIPIVCVGDIATNATKCQNDEVSLSGHLDITRVRRSNA